MARKKPTKPMVKVSITSRDASKDRFIPLADAQKFWNTGTLSYDELSFMPCVNERTSLVGFLELQPDEYEVKVRINRQVEMVVE